MDVLGTSIHDNLCSALMKICKSTSFYQIAPCGGSSVGSWEMYFEVAMAVEGNFSQMSTEVEGSEAVLKKGRP